MAMANDDSTAKFFLSLAGDGINIEREIDQDLALQILHVVLGGGAATRLQAPGRMSATIVAPAIQAPLSLREYLDNVQAARKPDQIVTIAQFICQYEGAEDFDRDDIKARFSKAREPLPSNFSRDFAWALSNGWIGEVHGKNGRYYVTTKGAQAIESRFSSEIKKSTVKTKRTVRSRRRDLVNGPNED